MSELRLEGIAFRYPGAEQTAVRDINLHVKEGEFVTILGSSGSGKTTVLRMIGGYLTPTVGRITVGDRDVTNIPPQKRNIGTVFQNYALFPHMSVFDNVAFGLRARRLPKADVRVRTLEALATVRLQDYRARMPAELSGGQQQRVALARAISIRPSVLLLDEPLGALDARLRESVQVEIKRVQRTLGITTISVTHDQNEAFSMSDRIVLMRDGDVVSVGTPEDLYLDPKTAYSAEFVGHAAVLPVEVTSWGDGGGRVRLRGSAAEFEVLGTPPDADKDAFLVVRPESIELCDHAIDGRTIPGTVLARRYTGFEVLLTVDVGAGRLVAIDKEKRYREEDVVNVCWDPSTSRILQG